MASGSARRCFYFAYGSNLSRWRISINVPSAVFHRVGRLEGFKVVFSSLKREPFSGPWKGAVATILPTEDAVCFGAVWSIDESEVSALDAQEMGYKPMNVQIHVGEETPVLCRTYKQERLPKYDPSMDKPSPNYVECILNGARECNLPPDYIRTLECVEHNDYDGPVGVKPSSD